MENDAAVTTIETDRSSIVAGFFLGLMLQGLVLFFPPALLFIGVAQLLYIVPAMILAARSGQRRLMKGLIIAASIVALLNAACWGFVASLQF